MALPARTKTWWVDGNLIQPAGTPNEVAVGLFLQIKAKLLSRSFTMRGASDGVEAGMDQVDRVTEPADCIAAASGAHTWIAIRQTGTGLEVCLDLVGSGPQPFANIAIYVSHSPFVGGSTTARPTAPGETLLNSISSPPPWGVQGGGQHVAHVLNSKDGKNTVVAICFNGKLCGLWLFGEVVRPIDGWTYKLYAAVMTGTSGAQYPVNWQQAAQGGFFVGWNNSGVSKVLLAYTEMLYISTAGPLVVKQGGPDQMFPGTYGNLWHVQPIGLICTAFGNEGALGEVPDVWWVVQSIPAISTNPPTGAMWPRVPEAPARQAFSVGGWLFPWGLSEVAQVA